MCKVTISLLQLFERFPDQDTARAYMEQRRWPDGAWCPHCGETSRIGAYKDGYYRCNVCMQTFTVRTKTVMQRSHIPLHKWLYGMYLLVTARKGISSVQLSKELGISQPSAWFMLQRLRMACKDDEGPLSGIVEIDETFVGGAEANRHKSKRLGLGRGTAGKQAVIGMRQRGAGSSGGTGSSGGSRVVAVTIPDTSTQSVEGPIDFHVDPGATLYTDEHSAYRHLKARFKAHETVRHGQEEFKRGEVHTNSIEAAWAVLKRGLYGVYHHVSIKHLDRYLDEFTFRLNQGACEHHTMARIDAMLSGAVGRRITYADLTA